MKQKIISENNSEIFKKLRYHRKRVGLSQKEMAKLITVPASTYKDWENGAEIRGEPYPNIAKALGITLDELFGVAETSDTVEDQLNKIVSIANSIKERIIK